MAHQLPEFEDAKDKWQAYLVKVEAYFEANDVKDDAKKRALLVAALGTKTIEILNGKVAPKKPNALTYAEVVQTLNSYYDPVPNEISESFKFFHRCQQEGESVHAFIVAIRQMAQNCNFSTMLDRMIRDRIVCGVRSKNLQKQLLAKKDLNLQEAEALALAAESAERDSQGITSDKEQASLLKLSAQYESRAKTAGVQQCNCCGKQGHRTNACRLIQRRCFKCTRRGHLARMCAVNDKTSRMLAVTAQATETEDSDNSASQIWSLTTKRSLIPPIRKEFAWNGIQVTMDIDTGSPVCVIPKSIYETYCHQWPQLQKSELQLSCYLGRLPLLGAITMPVSYEGTTVQCTLTILDCEGPSLCGRDLLKKLTDECIQVLNVYPQPSRSSQAQEVIPKLLQKNADLFTEGTGLMKGPPARLHIKTGSTPKFFKEPEAETENLTEMVLLIDQLDEPAVSHKELQALTEADAVLQEVCRYVTEGWPSVAGDSREMVEYWKRRHELSVEKGMLFWGHRVVIPRTAREKLLKLLHESHQGASTMKTRARVSFWWPGLDQDIQRAASDCKNCVQALPMPPERNRVSWPISRERWSRLHADYAGPISNKMLLVIVDAHSNWIEAIPVSRATANATVDSMRTLFSRFGLPRTIVTDNGTPFTGAEFAQFVQKNGIEHIRTPPYHPQSNGLAERAVRTLKDGLKRMPGVELSTALSRILCNYRNSPQASGVSPSELLLGYRLRTRLDICFSPRNHELPKNPGAESASWYFAPGDAVYVRNYGVGDKWTPGKVKSTSGARLVTVATEDGVVRRHVDQVRKRSSDTGASRETATPEEPPPEGQHRTTQDAPKCEADDLSESPVPELRRSTRIRKPVERYGS
ncbi:uncharacterized protein LOC119176573 isoform X2 [Rhipicephalus microplus]|uniref:uncharacterized protein LOC119176573 isoform X2 n=1 Tax=Rhipicephalus microplus TaxID=6941 RepID=UPI003F6C08C9